MLGFTSGRGNSVSEVIRCLRKSAGADGTFPSGTIYFAQNNDVRSVVRQHAFEPVARELRSLGIKSQIVQGIVPQGKEDIQGLTTGQNELNWTRANNRVLAGAICENFTSFGAVLAEHGTQTPLSVFIRAGAAGTCGTVAEPMAILNKFPHPMLHVHYARGCSLAEAFYQSVHGPYQLLIVGDPLCRPWAKIPKIGVKGLQAGQTVNGTLQITPTVLSPRDFQPRYFEIYLQGQKLVVVPPEESWDLDTTKLADGYLELRVVAVDSAAIQTQGHLTLPFSVNNNEKQVEFSIQPSDSVGWNEKLVVTASCPGSLEIVIFQHRRVLAKIEGDQGQAEIDPRLLGMGQITLYCIATGPTDTPGYVTAKPLRVHVTPPSTTPFQTGARPKDGFRTTSATERRYEADYQKDESGQLALRTRSRPSGAIRPSRLFSSPYRRRLPVPAGRERPSAIMGRRKATIQEGGRHLSVRLCTRCLSSRVAPSRTARDQSILTPCSFRLRWSRNADRWGRSI